MLVTVLYGCSAQVQAVLRNKEVEYDRVSKLSATSLTFMKWTPGLHFINAGIKSKYSGDPKTGQPNHLKAYQ